MTKTYYKTTSLCPACDKLLNGQVEQLEGGIYVTRTCPEHGYFRGLICSDIDWFESLERFDVPPVKPARHGTEVVRGCPADCGLCPSHRQIAGTAAIEISNHCNAKCPVCLADNQGTFELSVEEVRRMVEDLFTRQDHLDVLTLSGGEPTIHPQLLEIIDLLTDMDIPRIVLNTNGIRIATDDAFLDELAKRKNVYVCLHYDGQESRTLRGTKASMQEAALERLIRCGIGCVPLILTAQGVNETELGPITADLLKRSPAVKTVMLSMMTYAGERGTHFGGDLDKRMTIPAALAAMEEHSGGVLHKRDFIPLPMPNPLCAAIGYFLIQDDELIPIIPLAGAERVVEFLANSHFGEPDAAFERFFRDVTDEIYANSDRIPGGERLLSHLRKLIKKIFPTGKCLPDDERRRLVEEHIKAVYLMQFMDKWTFDSVRLRKCSCQHLLPDDKVIPSCGYYSYHRQFDPRFSGATA